MGAGRAARRRRWRSLAARWRGPSTPVGMTDCALDRAFLHAARHAEGGDPAGIEPLVPDPVIALPAHESGFAQAKTPAHSSRFRRRAHQRVIAGGPGVLGVDLHQVALLDQPGDRDGHDFGFGCSPRVDGPIGIVREGKGAGVVAGVFEQDRAERAVVATAADEHALVVGFGVGVVAELLFEPFFHHLGRGRPGDGAPERRGGGVLRLDRAQEEGGPDEEGLSLAAADEGVGHGVEPSPAQGRRLRGNDGFWIGAGSRATRGPSAAVGMTGVAIIGGRLRHSEARRSKRRPP